MNESTANYIWSFITTKVMGFTNENATNLDIERFCLDGDLPTDLDVQISRHFESNDEMTAVEAALVVARKFCLTSFKPNEHLLLIAYLLRRGEIDSEEACTLSQVDHSNFDLMSNEAKSISMLAESIAEEQRIGFIAVDADNLLERELNHYLDSHTPL